jgi:predicted ester cyclase
MSGEENAEVFRRMIEEGWNKGNINALDELFTSEFVEHQDGFSPPNLEGVKAGIKSLHTAFPDFKLTFKDLIADGDKTWAHMTARGTHQGQFMGITPPSRSFAITVIDICRYEKARLQNIGGLLTA